MKERKMIQVDKDIALKVKELYPSLSWSAILGLLLESKDLPKEMPKGLPDNIATLEDIKELKDKFSMVLTRLIDKNKLQR
jgi:hypothetical protein